jgi:hypothetical protein
MMADTRFNAKLQEKKVGKIQVKCILAKKRSLEGTSLSDQNSFAALSNDNIANIAREMRIIVQPSDFDKVDLLKDLEIARHALKNLKMLIDENLDEPHQLEAIPEVGEIPLLEWLDEDSEAEQFALVQSWKKKKSRAPIF